MFRGEPAARTIWSSYKQELSPRRMVLAVCALPCVCCFYVCMLFEVYVWHHKRSVCPFQIIWMGCREKNGAETMCWMRRWEWHLHLSSLSCYYFSFWSLSVTLTAQTQKMLECLGVRAQLDILTQTQPPLPVQEHSSFLLHVAVCCSSCFSNNPQKPSEAL